MRPPMQGWGQGLVRLPSPRRQSRPMSGESSASRFGKAGGGGSARCNVNVYYRTVSPARRASTPTGAGLGPTSSRSSYDKGSAQDYSLLSSRSGASSREEGLTYREGFLVVPQKSKAEADMWMSQCVQRDSLYEKEPEQYTCPDSGNVRRPVVFLLANIADTMLIEAEDRLLQRQGLTQGIPEQDIVHILTFVRQRATNASVVVREFFVQYDKFKTGYVTAHNSYRAFDAIRCFHDLSVREREIILETFSEARPAKFRHETFNYLALCELIQPSPQHHNSTDPVSKRYRGLRDAVKAFKPEQNVDSPYAVQTLTASGEERLALLMERLHHKVTSTRMNARELLGDYDAHLNGGTVGWMKKTAKTTQFVCNAPGCISYSQYMRGMIRLAGDMGLRQEDYDLIYAKYERQGAFNYYAFCHHLHSSTPQEHYEDS